MKQISSIKRLLFCFDDIAKCKCFQNLQIPCNNTTNKQTKTDPPFNDYCCWWDYY